MSAVKERPQVTVEVSSRRFIVPFECPCCGAVPDAEVQVGLVRSAHPVADDSARHLVFPYCERCIAHVSAWDSAGVTGAAICLGGLLAGIIVMVAVHVWVGLAIGFVAVALASWLVKARKEKARAMCRASCASPNLALRYLGWSGNTSAFAFQSPTYTARFAEQNEGQIANAGAELRRLLDGHRVARLAVPTPAAVGSYPPPLDTPGWIQKIASAPTRVARRHHLRIALDLVHDPAEQQQLVDAAARAELAPALARIARLGGDARRTFIEERIAEVRADNLPTPLQQAELSQLEHALSSA